MSITIRKVGGIDITRITFFQLESGKTPRCDDETIADAVRQVQEMGFVPASTDVAKHLVDSHTRRELPSAMNSGRLVILFEKDEGGHPFVALEPDNDHVYHGDGAFPGSKFVPVFLACVQQDANTATKTSAKAA